MFRKLLGQSPKDIAEAKILRDIEHTAFFQISSAFTSHKDLKTILEVITRESLNCLKANRSTIFLLDQTQGTLKTQATVSLDPQDEKVGLSEEEETARKALNQKTPILLQKPKYKGAERKITSLMSIPFFSQEGWIGVLSTILINGDRRFRFNQEDLRLLSILGNNASIALEMSRLQKEEHNQRRFRDNYEGYLDSILVQLQSLSEEGRRREEEHIGKLIKGRIFDEEKPPEGQNEKDVGGGIARLVEELKINSHLDNGGAERVQVELEDEYLSLTGSLGGGAFILKSNPMDLGDQFSMKLHLFGGRDPMDLVCKVIWTNKYGKESKGIRRGMGVKFLNLQPEVQKRIEESIKSHHLQAVGEIMVVTQR
jgi:Tfp pilus assembly protein PilZ